MRMFRGKKRGKGRNAWLLDVCLLSCYSCRGGMHDGRTVRARVRADGQQMSSKRSNNHSQKVKSRLTRPAHLIHYLTFSAITDAGPPGGYKPPYKRR